MTDTAKDMFNESILGFNKGPDEEHGNAKWYQNQKFAEKMGYSGVEANRIAYSLTKGTQLHRDVNPTPEAAEKLKTRADAQKAREDHDKFHADHPFNDVENHVFDATHPLAQAALFLKRSADPNTVHTIGSGHNEMEVTGDQLATTLLAASGVPKVGNVHNDTHQIHSFEVVGPDEAGHPVMKVRYNPTYGMKYGAREYEFSHGKTPIRTL